MDDKEKFMKDTIKLILETDNLRAEILIIHLAIEQIINKIIEKNFTKPEYIFKNI
ncbi:unnamed protein product [marine sediment metagenome]|uniref:Uncharacterized protein n=1 Tax=marine sediment metagenome TaxID=412755 RepID=X1KK04_9ZZZZ